VVVPRIAPKAVISSLEASKRSGGLLRALTCYLLYLLIKSSEAQFIQYHILTLFNLYVISSLWIRWKIYDSLSMANDAFGGGME